LGKQVEHEKDRHHINGRGEVPAKETGVLHIRP
jgi:hypothetical protein